MIRTIGRGFWLTVGAAVGVGGYRKVARLARAVSPARSAAETGSWQAPSARTADDMAWLVRGARASAGFARDVQEGMRIYRLSSRRKARVPRTQAAAGEWVSVERECSDDVKDGR